MKNSGGYMLRVQRCAYDIRDIINKTEAYCKELGISGQYSRINIQSNIKNYLDMACATKNLSNEELIILQREYDYYIKTELIEQYFKK